ncbi:MAG: response regulator, partial [bacterium]
VMPKLGGVDLAKQLLPDRPDLKVVYMSGYTNNAIVHNGMLTSGDAFLQKPFDPEAVLRKVRGLLDRSNKTGDKPMKV